MTTTEWTADAINILLLVLIVCVSVAGIIAVKGFVGEQMLGKRSIWFASVFGFLFMAYLVLHVLADLNLLAGCDALSGLREILPADWAQIFLVLGLVTVTGFYVLMAFRQAEEMREQRYSESLPLLVPNIPKLLPSGEFPLEFVRSGMGLKIVWRNVGKGVAINSRFSFWGAPLPSGKIRFFPSHESATLEVLGKKEVDYSENEGQLHEISGVYLPRFEAKYRDIYERDITTVQEIRIDEQNGGFSLGDLYFTVNGKRLGEEGVKEK